MYHSYEQEKSPSKIEGDSVEEEGFEPPVPRGTTVFKTAAFDHSATPLFGLISNRSAKIRVHFPFVKHYTI